LLRNLSQEAFRRLQCPTEQEGKDGLGNEIDWLAAAQPVPGILVQIGAEKDAAQTMARIKFVRSIDPAASVRQPNIHKGDMGRVQCGAFDCFGSACRYGADLVTEAGNQCFQIKGDKDLILNY